ncbi:MAG: HD domain-containing protein [Candidatus Moranbacteria bacterium]|nr:HD domain-containing protein [Candidatus Moranbacteria bacterium]
MDLLDQALNLARKTHSGVKREGGQPYITHPLAVLNKLKQNNMPKEALIAAVLHDVTEDSEVTNLEINQQFGQRVGFILYALSKNIKPGNQTNLRKKYQQEKKQKSFKSFQDYIDYRFLIYVNRFYISGIADPLILFIKLADHIHNTSTLKYLQIKKQKRKIYEFENFYFPIYKKAQEVITPGYIKRYRSLLKELKSIVEREKKRILKQYGSLDL